MKLLLRLAALVVCAVCLCAAQSTPQTPATTTEGPAADTSRPEVPLLIPPPSQDVTPKPETVKPAPAPPAVNQAPANPVPASQTPPATPPTAQPEAPAGAPSKPNAELEPPPRRKTPSSDTAAPTPKTAVKEGADGKPYVIGPLDVLYIRVWNNTNLTGMVDVRSDGMISLALVGEVKADGLTVQQLIEELKTKLGDYLNNPEVDVQVTKVNSKKFVIVGKVGRAGEFPLVGRTTIFEALANAGLRDDANLKKIYLLRGSVKHPFNYKDAEEGKHPEQDIPVENGDRIFVP